MLKLKGINHKLHFAGSTLSFIIICVITLTVIMNHRSKKDSLVINIAGKQRMLTQKISREILYIKQNQSTDYRELDASVGMFENSLNDLMHGNSKKEIYSPQNEKIKSKLEEVELLWTPFRGEIERVKKDVVLLKKELEFFDESDVRLKAMMSRGVDGETIDLLSQQRMLSLRMGFFVQRYLRTNSELDYLQFNRAKNIYDETIYKFLSDKKVQTEPELYAVMQRNYGEFKEYEKHLLAIIKVEKSLSSSIAYIDENSIKLLNTMDAAVWLYTEYSEEKNSMFIKFQYISLAIALIIILFSFILSREIVNHINEFVDRAKALQNESINRLNHADIKVDEGSEHELIEASSYLCNFVKKVNVAMKHSEDAIMQAESALLDLQNLADSVDDALGDLHVGKKEKDSFDKRVNATEDIAIESAENLIHVRKMLEKLRANLNTMVENSKKLH